MSWNVDVNESVIEDLRWFGSKNGRWLLQCALEHLEADPLAETTAMKTLRMNPVAERELRLFGKYRFLFDVDEKAGTVTLVTVGEKKGNRLFVRGREFKKHHESHSAEQGESSP